MTLFSPTLTKKEKTRIICAHTLGIVTGASVLCLVMCCKRKSTPADKIKKAFKELEEKLEV